MFHRYVYNGMTGFMLIDYDTNPFKEPFERGYCVPEPGPQPEDIISGKARQAAHKGFGLRMRDLVAGLFVSKPVEAVEPYQTDC